MPYEWTSFLDKITGKPIQSYETFLHSACTLNSFGIARCDAQEQLSLSINRSRNRELFQQTWKEIAQRNQVIKSKKINNITESWLLNEDCSAVFEAIVPSTDEMIPIMFSDWNVCSVEMGNTDGHICKLAQGGG